MFLARATRAAGVVMAGSALGPLGRAATAAAAGRAVEPGPPRIYARAEWGADESLRRGTPIFNPIRKFVVHHTASATGGDSLADMRDIYRSHLARDGGSWKDIGYNYVIDPAGRIFEGRHARTYGPGETPDGEDPFGRGVRGSHAGEANPGSVGIALMGNFEGSRPTDAAIESLVALIAWKCARHGLDPLGGEGYLRTDGTIAALPTIIAHRDVRVTACPGVVMYGLLDDVRRRVAERVPPAAVGSGGYRLLHGDGSFTLRGSAPDAGDLRRRGVLVGAASLAARPGSDGFWVLDRTGGVHGFGAAGYHGSLPELVAAGQAPGGAVVERMAATASGNGYWVLDRQGGVFAFGDAGYAGSVPQLRSEGVPVGDAPAVAIAGAPGTTGYWILDRLGGVFGFGGAPYFGSVPELRNQGMPIGDVPALDLQPTPSGRGYWVLDLEGGVFAFGDAPFFGSVPASGSVGADARRLVPAASGRGYSIVCRDGSVLAFGDAPFHHHGPNLDTVDLVPTA